ncbi:AAA family ATPase [Aquabacterium sp.]|uniref:AAA family ATPase n=1 Tax=Aquabacterium sp. TaxID=1872578 RepID=UPI0025C14A57|nr:AAA family ATPase [Aquabacterium sp.]
MAYSPEYPTDWSSTYTDADKTAVCRVLDALAEHRASGWTCNSLARVAGRSGAAVSTVLGGKYTASPTAMLARLLAQVDRMDAPPPGPNTRPGYVETSVHRAVWAACKRARTYGNFAVVSAYVGTGKTHAVREYQRQHPDTVLVEAVPGMTASVLLDALVEETGAVVRTAGRYTSGSLAERMRAVVRTLRGSDRLLILDEADTTTAATLEHVRRIRDLAGVGVVLAGTERLRPMLQDPRGRFGQISSRVGFWPPVIKSITADDAAALATAALEQDGIDPDAAVLDALWQACAGSARVLCEGVIPGVRDYGLAAGHALTPELVYRVAQDLLGFRRRDKVVPMRHPLAQVAPALGGAA